MKYEYDAAAEPSYLDSLVKSFKKNVTDGFFPFIIVDCTNDKLKKYEDMYNFAKMKGFQVSNFQARGHFGPTSTDTFSWYRCTYAKGIET